MKMARLNGASCVAGKEDSFDFLLKKSDEWRGRVKSMLDRLTSGGKLLVLSIQFIHPYSSELLSYGSSNVEEICGSVPLLSPRFTSKGDKLGSTSTGIPIISSTSSRLKAKGCDQCGHNIFALGARDQFHGEGLFRSFPVERFEQGNE
ncbi:hypothetical protein Tco_1253993 [Tanacetum coccineum]